MSEPHAQYWAHVIEKQLDQLKKNKIWTLVLELDIEQDHKLLSEK